MKHTDRYDLAFSVGASCNCSMMLRKAGLQYESFPLDWLWRTIEDQPISEIFRLHVDMAINDFKGMLQLENLNYVSREGDRIHSHVDDRGSGVTYYHDFPCQLSIEESYSSVLEKYRRRIARFRRLLTASRSVLAVWIGDARDNGCITEEDIAYCLRQFSNEYPHVRFHMLVIDCPKDFPVDEHRIVHGNGFDRHMLNFRYEGEMDVKWRISERRVLPILTGYAVRDYRTSKEKSAYRRRKLQAELAFFHASSRFAMLCVKLQYRLYCHLRKRFLRRGVRVEGI